MSLEDYTRACRLGKKDYQLRLFRGERPTLKALNEILPSRGECSEVPLGLVQIPTERIVGTKTNGRSNAFSGNFMPVLKPDTEFASKWIALSDSHMEEGIREPIKAYEYMNQFYVEEGNKRVSVLKYFDAVSIPGNVTRVIPPRTQELENKIYYEFLDFYEKTGVNYLWFSKLGSFKRLQLAVKGSTEEIWTQNDRLTFSSVYTRFSAEYKQRVPKDSTIHTGDAFLSFLELYNYPEACAMTTSQIQELVEKSWEEFELLEEEEGVDLKLKPAAGEKKTLLSRLLPQSIPHLKIGFIYAKTPSSSSWTYNHELGRLYLEQRFPQEVETVAYENTTEETIGDVLYTAIEAGCNLIFTTAPSFATASVKAAIDHPEIYILNCSLNTSHRYIRTYYARMFEAKFLLGAVAGAMAENERIAYIGDYPIYGSIANINAFALGAKMINPRTKIYLDWSSRKDCDVNAFINYVNPTCISGRDMLIPEDTFRIFGLYHFDGKNHQGLAIPLCHWGKFYEQLINNIIEGSWEKDDDTTVTKAINYWWGMSAKVVDIVCSENMPVGTARLIDLLRHTIKHEKFNPFTGILYSQEGMVQSNPGYTLNAMELATMDWLAENVIGYIPKKGELSEGAKPVVTQQGVKGTAEEA